MSLFDREVVDPKQAFLSAPQTSPLAGGGPTDLEQIERFATSMIHGDFELEDPDVNDRVNFIRSALLMRRDNIQEPRPRNPNVPFSPAQLLDARRYEASRLSRQMDTLEMLQSRWNAIENFRRRDPKRAEELGLGEQFSKNMKKWAVGGVREGWRVVDTLLRNLDRGRGAIAAYTHTLAQGGYESDALRRAKQAFLGSERGWKWVPEIQGPLFKEVLAEAGIDEGFGRTAGGFALDVIADPINLLGIGASRKALEVGAHQFLNKAGRSKYAQFLRKAQRSALTQHGAKDLTDLPVEAVSSAFGAANKEMRVFLRELPKAQAQTYFDMGGLKFAGYTLPGTSFLRKQHALINGKWKHDWVTSGLPSLVLHKTTKGIEKVGRGIGLASDLPIAQRMSQFLEMLPTNIRDFTTKLGIAFSRTNPAAGRDYKYFKQQEYLEKLGYDIMRVSENVHRTFDGIHSVDLEHMAFAIDRGKVPEFLENVRRLNGQAYHDRVKLAVFEYQQLMDDIIVDEVKRGWFHRGWDAETKALFEQWVRNPNAVEPILHPAMLQKFRKVKLDQYVPIIPQNLERVKLLAPAKLENRAPSITEVFTKKRDTPNLDAAVSMGYVPLTNLKQIATIRMMAHARASVTSDFLEAASARYGNLISEAVGASESIKALYKPNAETTWSQVLKMRTAGGRLARDTSEQIDLARQMAFDPDVPVEAVRVLDDRARDEFIRFRMRHVGSNGAAHKVWRKYVENPTSEGIYNGYRHTPGGTRDPNRAYAEAKQLADDVYPAWRYMKVGGLGDPEVLGKVMLPLPIADDLARLQKYDVLPEEVNALFSLYDRLNFWWKRGVTILWPAFHVRNKLTNVLNSAMDIGLGGILNRKTMWAIMRGADGTLVTDSGRYSYSQIRQLMRKHGVINLEYRRVDVPTSMMADIMEKETRPARRIAKELGLQLPGRQQLIKRGEQLGPAQVSNPLINPMAAGEEMGILIENSDRAQLFIQSLIRGMDPHDAARRVNKFLFDYNDLGVVDNKLIKRFFNPFWTWTRKNLALQAKLVANRPGKWVTPSKFARAMSVEADKETRSELERKILPRHFRDYFGVRLEVGEGVSRWLMNVDVPGAELDKLWTGSARRTMMEWVGMVGPHIKSFAEYVSQRDFYRDKPQASFFSGQKMYPIVEELTRIPGMRKLLGIREDTIRGERRIMIDGKAWKAFNYLTMFLASRLYTTVGRVTDPHAGTIPERVLTMLTGMRTEYIDMEDELTRMADELVRKKNTGLADNINKAYYKWRDEMAMNGIAMNEAQKDMRLFRDAITTPEIGAELDDPEHDGKSWTREEGL